MNADKTFVILNLSDHDVFRLNESKNAR